MKDYNLQLQRNIRPFTSIQVTLVHLMSSPSSLLSLVLARLQLQQWRLPCSTFSHPCLLECVTTTLTLWTAEYLLGLLMYPWHGPHIKHLLSAFPISFHDYSFNVGTYLLCSSLAVYVLFGGLLFQLSDVMLQY